MWFTLLPPPFPRNVLIEPTNACNHKCIFCPNDIQKRKSTIISVPFVKSILTQAYDLGSREVGFYLGGEPLLCNSLSEQVQIASDIGFEYIYITTNGSVGNIQTMTKLIDSGMNSIKFSINAASPETYKIVHGKDDYMTVKKNIEDLHDYIVSKNLSVGLFISFVTCKENEHETELIHQEFDELVDQVYVNGLGNRGGSMNDLIDYKSKDIKPCEMIFNRIHITSSGFLSACCADENGMLSVADLREVSLHDAWYSDTMTHLREQHLSGKLEKNQCYNCLYLSNEDVLPLNNKLYCKDIK